MIQSLVLLNEAGFVKPDDLPEMIKKNIFLHNNLYFKELKKKLNIDFEISFLKSVLNKTKGNVSKASKIIKLSRKNFNKKLKIYNIVSSKYK